MGSAADIVSYTAILPGRSLIVNIVDVIELAMDDFKASHGRRPKRMKLGRKQVTALRKFADRYSSHAARPTDKSGPMYQDILIDETAEDDQLVLE